MVPLAFRGVERAGLVFALLLVFFFPPFWIGLCIKESYRVCRGCGLRLDG